MGSIFGKLDPDPEPHQSGKLDQDRHKSEKQDPDPQKGEKVKALEARRSFWITGGSKSGKK
jgi:hypothetical protein